MRPFKFSLIIKAGFVSTSLVFAVGGHAAIGAVEVGKSSTPVGPPSAPVQRGKGTSDGRTGLDERIRTTADELPVKAGKRGGAGKYQLRCWQFGRLVFEESRDSLLAESTKVVTVARNSEAGETVQLVDLASSSCVLSVAP